MHIKTKWKVTPINTKKTNSERLGAYNLLIGKKIGVNIITLKEIMWMVVRM
jgi:hypothetical protein